MYKKYLLTLLVMLVGLFSSYAQSPDLTYSIIFDFNSDKIDLEVADNRQTIENLLEHMDQIYSDTTKVVTRIMIDSYSSPEGGVTYNRDLSLRRSNSLYDYLVNRTPFDRELYDIRSTGINWDMLIEQVENSDMEYKNEVLNILKYTPEETWRQLPNNKYKTLVDSRNKQLMDLKGGVPYNYMKDNFFPQLRIGSALSLYYEQKYPTSDSAYVEQVDTVYQAKNENVRVVQPRIERDFLFALKTNLLFDVILIPNLELEVPIGDRYSVNAEYGQSWMKDKSTENNWCHQYKGYGIEGRYWFGDRTEMKQLTGLFGGVYLGRYKFDIQRNSNKGTQRDIDFSVGLSGGYSIPLIKHFNMEFSAAVGYVNGTSNKYSISENGSLVRREPTRNISTIFPTKAKVSLVWLVNPKIR